MARGPEWTRSRTARGRGLRRARGMVGFGAPIGTGTGGRIIRSLGALGRGADLQGTFDVGACGPGSVPELSEGLHVDGPWESCSADASIVEGGLAGLAPADPEDAASWGALLPAPKEARIGQWNVLQIGHQKRPDCRVHLEQLQGVVHPLHPARTRPGGHQEAIQPGEAGRGENDDPGAGHGHSHGRPGRSPRRIGGLRVPPGWPQSGAREEWGCCADPRAAGCL